MRSAAVWQEAPRSPRRYHVGMFGATPRIKISRQLYEKLERVARAGGYATTQELIVHVLEREAARFDATADEAEIEKQLRGLGYIE